MSEAGHRERIINEIVESERTYVSQLQAIIEVYLEPLKSLLNKPNPPCTEQRINELFSNFQLLYPVNRHFLEILEKHLDKNSTQANGKTQTLGALLINHFHFFRIYIPFVNHFEKMMQLLTKQMAKPAFAQFVLAAKLNPLCKGLSLDSLLITPIQRLPRYKLLVEQLIKYTPEQDPEHEQLKAALDLISLVVVQVNRAVQERERNEKLLEIQELFSGDVELLKPGRRYIRQDSFQKICRKGPKKFEFFLFSDAVMYAYKQSNGKLVLHRTLPIKFADAREGSSRPELVKDNSQLYFHILSKEKSFDVLVENANQKVSWLKDFQIAKYEAENVDPRRQSGIVDNNTPPPIPQRPPSTSIIGEEEHAPVHVPDSLAPNCHTCQVKFSVVKRRYRCQKCGVAVCNLCCCKPPPTVDCEGKDQLCTSCLMICMTPRGLRTTRSGSILHATLLSRQQAQSFAHHDESNGNNTTTTSPSSGSHNKSTSWFGSIVPTRKGSSTSLFAKAPFSKNRKKSSQRRSSHIPSRTGIPGNDNVLISDDEDEDGVEVKRNPSVQEALAGLESDDDSDDVREVIGEDDDDDGQGGVGGQGEDDEDDDEDEDEDEDGEESLARQISMGLSRVDIGNNKNANVIDYDDSEEEEEEEEKLVLRNNADLSEDTSTDQDDDDDDGNNRKSIGGLKKGYKIESISQ